MSDAASTNPTPSKKISSKVIIGNVKQAIKALGGKPDQVDDEGQVTEPANYVQLFTAVGVITGVKTGTSTYGPWIAYVGDINAVNHVTGEIFMGRELLLPEEANILLAEPLTKATLEGRSVEVALAIEACLFKSVVGYKYRVKPRMQMEQRATRGMELLQQYGGAKVPALEAPKTEDAKVEEMTDEEVSATRVIRSMGKKRA